MTTQHTPTETYSSMLIAETPLMVSPRLAETIGLNEAIFLQQLHYWLNRSRHEYDGRRYIFNTYQAWHEQFPFWSVITIKRIVASLRDKELIETRSDLNKLKVDRTLWYTINYHNIPTVTLPVTETVGPTLTPETEWAHEDSSQIPARYQSDTGSKYQSDTGSRHQLDTTNTIRIPETTTENTSYAPAAHKPAATPTPHQELFGAICEACGLDPKTLGKQASRIGQVASVLAKAEYTPQDIQQFMTTVWFRDWRWVDKHSWPTPTQLQAEIGKIHSTVPAAAPITSGMQSLDSAALAMTRYANGGGNRHANGNGVPYAQRTRTLPR